LNLADALLTHAVISNGLAREANPVVTAVGLPAKVVGVACVSALVTVLKPRALWIPITALAAVVIYTLVNLVLS
jgi:MFS superfamily sulfate permease-like transporter